MGRRSPKTKNSPPPPVTSTKSAPTPAPLQVRDLPPAMQAFHKLITIVLPPPTCGVNPKAKKKHSHNTDSSFNIVNNAVSLLNRYNMLILHNVFTPPEITKMHREYLSLLDRSGQTAIGEKDASKRSGTRFYNCNCQLGPACSFSGWKDAAPNVREIMGRGEDGSPNADIWRQIVRKLGFEHIARVEMVTGHSGCRSQGWHVDGLRGVTAIFSMVDVDVAKGPTELDFDVPFLSIDENKGKCSRGVQGAPSKCYAVMPAGSVLMFNANVTHRGTANLSKVDRPVLVLDCSADCGMI